MGRLSHPLATIPGPLLSEPLDRLRQLLARLHRDWQSYRHMLQQRDVPTTNNATEQAIGRFKVRSRSMRGLKAWSGMEAAMLLTSGTAA